MKIPEDTLVKFITMFYEMELDGTMSGPQGQVRLMRFIENVWNDGLNIGIPVLSKTEAQAGFASEEAILLKDNPEDWRHVESKQLSKQHEDRHGDCDSFKPHDGWAYKGMGCID